ncbi:CDP-alcohol phosphatidyltransferase family protein [Ruminococcus sp.]|uniref:CDP-alcohol phosphatidyltransferase family protein n=2 Tax=Ruminococcus TaxID=1263 RepID=UPI00261C89CC|nr:CDP-alcohol phosphatidyltransferase family protein [Ruminococcus sp.]MDD7555720.1 CDP-alcohol phosphatidyltransferase family protein [Ruminococcus sp.]
MAYQNPVKKIIPSRLETGVQQFLYKHVGKHIPGWMTPNQVTLIGALGGLLAIVSTVLTRLSPWFFLGTIAGLAVHLVADDLDGYVARQRQMASRAGAYFDLITDVLISTFLLIALGFSPYGSPEVMIFAAPVYGIVNVTAMNYILYCNEFLFPRLGPIEAHITYGLVAVLSMLTRGHVLFTLLGVPFRIADLIVSVGLLPMYYEMFRLQIQLFCRLKKQEKP